MIKKPKPILRKKRIKRRPIIKSCTPTKPYGQTIEKEMKGNEAEAEPSKKKNTLKFAAPIKIIVIGPKSEYCKTVWCAIGIAITNVAIGAVLMTVLRYSLKTDDIHALICVIGYHFFSAEAILALHYANGWSSPMRVRHKKVAHMFLHMCGIICSVVGTTIILVRVGVGERMMTRPHGLTGLITLFLITLASFFGPFAYRRRKTWVLTLHMSLGITAFIMSSLCVCFGLTSQAFIIWAGDTVTYLLTALVIFYTVFIVTSSFMKCMSRL